MIDLSGYVVTDPFFGPPYIDKDEDASAPMAHRFLHGGFEGTDTRFSLYFPTDGSYQGRLINPLAGGHGGHEGSFSPSSVISGMIGGLDMAARLGGYMVECNQGHIGDTLDPKAGDDPTIYGWRASAEVARFSKFMAEQVYGQPPHHSYIWGGSGGGRRSPLCLEYAPDAWDAAMPFVGGGTIVEHGSTRRHRSSQAVNFATMFNCKRILGDKVLALADAMAPGGHGDPFAGLDTHQREELTSLYLQGFPRGDEFMIGEPMGQMWLWSALADSLQEQDPAYFENFWSKPGYVGHDNPEYVVPDVIDVRATVTRTLTVQDVLDDPEFLKPQYQNMRNTVAIMGGHQGLLPTASDGSAGMPIPLVVQIEGVGTGYRPGAGVRIVNGSAAGRRLYAMQAVGDFFFCDGVNDANILRFAGVLPGDEVHVDNHAFLAYCYFARHHLMEMSVFDHFRVDGVPIHPQHPLPDLSPMMGVGYSGQYRGKLMWIHHTHDSSLWPYQGVVYRDAVLGSQGEEGIRERFRHRWIEHAEHAGATMVPSLPNRAASTWLIDYGPFLEQSLRDVIAWVEQGIDPVNTTFDLTDGKITLPDDAKERKGIQAVVSVAANGAVCTEVRVGEPVTLELQAEVPPKAGTIIAAEWDFDGTGAFPFAHAEVDGTAAAVTLTTTHTYERPGTYFVTGRVYSHRDGDVKATSCRIPNVAQARVIVT